MTPTHPVHPLGGRAKVLLSSVFGPYAQDDEYGSRAINPMELYQNQVTRVQGPFSLRMFHRSWGIMLIQANIDAPCALLDFPSLDRFVQEISSHRYDIVGISSIISNVDKVRVMCELVRQHLPEATIVVGGHVANLPDLPERIDADHIVRGEGVRWMRGYLSEDEGQPIRHPRIVSGVGARAMGVALRAKPGDVAATLIPSVGCPLGCNFCSTSAMFGGKGKFVHFYETGDELFEVMCELEEAMRVRSFFVMDENFLAHRKRALRLLELMVEHGKPWALYVFSSANVLRSYSIEQLVGLGVSWVWMGLEGKETRYRKLTGIDTAALVRTLQEHGTCVLGSTIIGLEEHSPENIDAAIDYAVGHDTEFHQFMLYTAIPGTPLYAEHVAKGTLLGPRRAPAGGYPRAIPVQLPASSHPQRPGDGVPAPGLPPRLRRQRAQRLPGGAHDPQGLATLQGPRRSEDTRALCVAGPQPGSRACRSGLGSQALVPIQPRAASEALAHAEGVLPGVRAQVPPRRAGGRTLSGVHAPARGAPASRRLDVRATHLP